MAIQEIQHGQAVLWGIGEDSQGITGYAAILAVTAKGSHKIKLDTIEDEIGDDAALIATNSMIEADIAFVPETGTVTFPTPPSSITLSGFKSNVLDGAWIYMGDAAIDL